MEIDTMQFIEITNKLNHLDLRLSENTEATNRIDESTKEVVLAFNSAKGAFRVLEFIGMLAKPIFLLISVSAVVYGTVTWAKNLFK